MSVINEDSIEYIAIHCSATEAGKDFTAEDINRWHKDRGWSEIGYHFVVRLDGHIEIGRDLDSPGAHVKGFNKHSWGVCYIGGLADGNPADTRTPEQKASINHLLRVLKLTARNAKIMGHNEFPGVNKACPCYSVKDSLPDDLKG